MAIVTKQSTQQQWTGNEQIIPLLSSHGILYENWDVSRLEQSPALEGESAQEHVLRVFADEITRISEQHGYRTADVVALSPATPNLDDLLAKFDKEHYHTEDEVRFVVSGRGVFSIRGKDDEMYDVEVRPGDLLAVPEGTYHYFDLCEDRNIQCIRLFTDMTGWVAHYVNP